MSYVRVYHPETNEPFDVPEAKATELRLQFGWLSSAFENVKSDASKVEAEAVVVVKEVEAEAINIEVAAVAEAKEVLADIKDFVSKNAPKA